MQDVIDLGATAIDDIGYELKAGEQNGLTSFSCLPDGRLVVPEIAPLPLTFAPSEGQTKDKENKNV
jgi:hypothetical protein